MVCRFDKIYISKENLSRPDAICYLLDADGITVSV